MTVGRRRLVSYAAVGLLPFAASAWLSGCVCLDLANWAAGQLLFVGLRLTELTRFAEPAPLPPTPEAARVAALSGEVSFDGPERDEQGRSHEPGSETALDERMLADARPLPEPVGVFVSRERVLSAARAGIRPEGTPVAAASWRPPGIALRGVGALGVGLQDGDILVSAGVPATSDGAVVAAVVDALRRHARAMSGVVWRGRQKILVTVELPDLGKVDTPRTQRHTVGR